MTTGAAETVVLLFLLIFRSVLQGISTITKINVQLCGSEFYFLPPFTNLSSKKNCHQPQFIPVLLKVNHTSDCSQLLRSVPESLSPIHPPPSVFASYLGKFEWFFGCWGFFNLLFPFWKSIVIYLISLEIILFLFFAPALCGITNSTVKWGDYGSLKIMAVGSE